MKILIVDDSISGRVLACTLVKACFGIPKDNEDAVDQAKDGPEALDAMNRQRYDLLVTDMQMPTMNGDQLIAAIRNSEHRDIPAILASASALKPEEMAGADAFCMKPLKMEALKIAIETALAKRGNAISARQADIPIPAPLI